MVDKVAKKKVSTYSNQAKTRPSQRESCRMGKRGRWLVDLRGVRLDLRGQNGHVPTDGEWREQE